MAVGLAASTMDIVLVSRAPIIGGAEVAWLRLGLGLAEAGYRPWMVLPAESPVNALLSETSLTVCHVPVRPFSWGGAFGWWLAGYRLAALARRLDRPVFIANDLPTAQVVGAAVRGLAASHLCYHRFAYPAEALAWFGKYRIDRHLFVSEALRQMLTDRWPAVSSVPCAVVHDGLPIPAPPDNEQRHEACLSVGSDPQRLQVCFVGQLIERKGVDDLLTAWGLLRTLHDQVALTVVGDDIAGNGAYRRYLSQRCEQENLPVRFAGFQSQVGPWWRSADLAVVPSHFDPLGNSVLEAMAHGLPVVATRVGGIPEMVVDGQTGLLCEARAPVRLAEVMRQLLMDADARKRMGQAGYDRCVDRFSISHHVQMVLSHCRQTLSEMGDG